MNNLTGVLNSKMDKKLMQETHRLFSQSNLDLIRIAMLFTLHQVLILKRTMVHCSKKVGIKSTFDQTYCSLNCF